MNRKIILIFNIVCILGCVLGEVPSFIKVCGRRDPNLNECVRNAVDTLRPRIKVGIPELDAPSVEPFSIPEGLPLVDSPDLKAYATNIKLYGFADFKLTNVNVDLANKKIDVGVHIDSLRLVGDYDVNTRVVVPVNVKGPVQIDVQDIDGAAILRFQTKVTKRGELIYFPSMSLKLKVKDYRSKFVPREGADATFGEAINSVLNGNRQEIIAGIQPSLEKAISAKILELANQICKNFTFDELFPDRE